MDLKQVAKDTAKVLTSYFTYQALRIVLAQLSENDPPQALWLHAFSSKNSIQDGETYLLALLQEKQELAFRLMTVRQHLAEEVSEFLPEMVCASIQQSNMEHRRQHLERMTQLTVSDPTVQPKQTDSESEKA
ncbi:MAG: chaperonin family protein RbcX [Coleofasciculaceae cyanobacterium]